MFGVEGESFLSNDQRDRGNLPRQRQAGHLWSHSFGHQRRVELLERAGLGRSDDGGTLKQILQIVIVIAVESANRYLLFRSL